MTHVTVAKHPLRLWCHVHSSVRQAVGAVVVAVVVMAGVHRCLGGEAINEGGTVFVEQEGRRDHRAHEGANPVETVHGLCGG